MGKKAGGCKPGMPGPGKPCRPCKPGRPVGPGRRGEAELFGIILVIFGLVTIGAFLLPSKLWLIIMGLIMVFLGAKLLL